MTGNNENYYVTFENFHIKYIKTIMKENSIFIFCCIEGNFILTNGKFEYNNVGYLINILHIGNNLTLENIIFYENLVTYQVLNLEMIFFVNLQNLSCINNNFGNILMTGGCFRIENAFFLLINALKVVGCYSSQSTVGVIIIDKNLKKNEKSFNTAWDIYVNFFLKII